jgi:L-asparaginase II
MCAAPGWLAKGGAEGLLCAAGPDGTGVALKTEDGTSRAHAPALAAFLARLGVDLPDLAVRPVRNTRGETVGEIAGVAGATG